MPSVIQAQPSRGHILIGAETAYKYIEEGVFENLIEFLLQKKLCMNFFLQQNKLTFQFSFSQNILKYPCKLQQMP